MKNFRRVCVTLALSLVFTLPALAGDIDTPAGPDPGDGHSPGSPMTGYVSEPVPADEQCPIPARSGDVHSPAWIDMVLMMQDLMF
jgi:hypothetical protein